MATAMTRTSMNPKHLDSTAGSIDALPRSGHVFAPAFDAGPPGF